MQDKLKKIFTVIIIFAVAYGFLFSPLGWIFISGIFTPDIVPFLSVMLLIAVPVLFILLAVLVGIVRKELEGIEVHHAAQIGELKREQEELKGKLDELNKWKREAEKGN